MAGRHAGTSRRGLRYTGLRHEGRATGGSVFAVPAGAGLGGAAARTREKTGAVSTAGEKTGAELRLVATEKASAPKYEQEP
eukprot:355810-Chlamydomonas_euryale.AAC.5